jgi:hypothetical protein
VQGLQTPLAALTLVGDPLVYPDKAFNGGRTLPLQLKLLCGSMLLTDADVAAPRIVAITLSGQPLDLETMDLDAGQSNDSGVDFRYESGAWKFNLSTKGWATGSYVVTIQTPDGRRYNAAFVLR